MKVTLKLHLDTDLIVEQTFSDAGNLPQKYIGELVWDVIWYIFKQLNEQYPPNSILRAFVNNYGVYSNHNIVPAIMDVLIGDGVPAMRVFPRISTNTDYSDAFIHAMGRG